ncbi:MAG: PilZ domain-containing protein [Candidatus Aminicenantes bacterium]|nr:PilZ domain-containing protein [Candidatus Aminicenantes bacterium]
MEKRKEKRIRKRMLSSLEDRPAIIVDISQGGIQISMSSTPKNQLVSIKLQIGGKVINLYGDIRWINKTISSQNSSNIGIAIHEAPPEYLQLFEARA